MAHKVRVRQKAIQDHRQSLYLEFYPAIPHPTKKGKVQRKEYLKLYIHDKPKTTLEKQHNKQTLQLAEQVRQQWENRLNKPEIYTEFEREQLKKQENSALPFIPYFEHLTKTRKESNRNNWASCMEYLKLFADKDLQGETLTFAHVTERFCNGFKHYLQTAPSRKSGKTTLSANAAASYFSKFKAALKEAYKDELLPKDINSKLSSIAQEDSDREHLTPQELQAMAKAPCNDATLKKAAIFSALTGLRFSDIHKLTWGEIRHADGKGHSIAFRQQKTKGMEHLPIAEQAYRLLGEPQAHDKLVFEGLKYSAYKNRHLLQWTKDAGVRKHITFHCFRHTFAVHQLLNGTDIYTLSKLLGHKDLKTTQIYAKIVDSMKRQAMDKVTFDLDLNDFE